MVVLSTELHEDPQIDYLLRDVQQWSGLRRLQALETLTSRPYNYTIKQVEEMCGLSENYLSTWKYRYNKSKKSGKSNQKNNHSNQKLISDIQKTNLANQFCRRLISKIEYDFLIENLSGKYNKIPYATMILDRTEGEVKRDRSMVRAVLFSLQQILEGELKDIIQEELDE